MERRDALLVERWLGRDETPGVAGRVLVVPGRERLRDREAVHRPAQAEAVLPAARDKLDHERVPVRSSRSSVIYDPEMQTCLYRDA